MKLPIWLGVFALLSSLPSAVRAEEPTRPWKPTKDAVNIYYSGTVTEVTKDSITVRWPGEQPKKFAVSAALAAGEIPKEPRLLPGMKQPYTVRDCLRYRLTDVAVGDEVWIAYAHLGDEDICDHICINKRPNGLVPPLPEGAEAPRRYAAEIKKRKPYLFIPYHEKMNAYWDLEDHGIPYPEKFGPLRRFPVAPMPREVKLGPATP
jgi:hypothetical protein